MTTFPSEFNENDKTTDPRNSGFSNTQRMQIIAPVRTIPNGPEPVKRKKLQSNKRKKALGTEKQR